MQKISDLVFDFINDANTATDILKALEQETERCKSNATAQQDFDHLKTLFEKCNGSERLDETARKLGWTVF